MLDYKIITGKHHAIRRSNRETFLDRKREAETTHEISILMICYNHIDQFFAALERVHREAVRNNLVITIVQNSDQEEALHTFEERIIPYTHINVLYPKQNLGSAGGYAFGQEYVLSKGYSHFLIIEDDVELYDDDTISKTVETIEDKNVVFINPPVNAGGEHSRYVQFACYPTSLLEHAGVVDPRYFFRAEDIERGKRLEATVLRYKYTKTIVDRNYYHPYLKGGNNSGSWIYFSLRNQLYSFRKHHNGLVLFIIGLIQYLAFALLVFFRSGKSGVLQSVWSGLSDGLRKYKPLSYHGEMIRKIGMFEKFELSDIGFSTQGADFALLQSGLNTRNIISRTTIAAGDKMHLGAYGGKLLATGGFQPVWGTVVSTMKKLLVIEHLNRDKKEFAGKVLSQSRGSQNVNILLFLPCVLLGCIGAGLSALRILGVTYSHR